MTLGVSLTRTMHKQEKLYPHLMTCFPSIRSRGGHDDDTVPKSRAEIELCQSEAMSPTTSSTNISNSALPPQTLKYTENKVGLDKGEEPLKLLRVRIVRSMWPILPTVFLSLVHRSCLCE